jgi:hypothetical protein
MFMPTPFYHLSLAQEILVHPELPSSVRQWLLDNRCDFFLGKTAPDVQTISGQDRASTHFFKLPLGDQPPAWETFLRKHPDLSNPIQLSPGHAAFIAGYLCHLQADVYWIKKIFWPNIAEPKPKWENLKERLYLHNVLRAYLDEQILKNLQEDMDSCLDQVQFINWLPFVEDKYLIEWRNLLSKQLQPNGKSQTAEVFAKRMGVTKDGIERIIQSEDQMEDNIFRHINRQELVKYRELVIFENIQFLSNYFKD